MACILRRLSVIFDKFLSFFQWDWCWKRYIDCKYIFIYLVIFFVVLCFLKNIVLGRQKHEKTSTSERFTYLFRFNFIKFLHYMCKSDICKIDVYISRMNSVIYHKEPKWTQDNSRESLKFHKNNLQERHSKKGKRFSSFGEVELDGEYRKKIKNFMV